MDGGSSAPGIRLAGVTNSVHFYDVLTRKWTGIKPAGEPGSHRHLGLLMLLLLLAPWSFSGWDWSCWAFH